MSSFRQRSLALPMTGTTKPPTLYCHHATTTNMREKYTDGNMVGMHALAS